MVIAVQPTYLDNPFMQSYNVLLADGYPIFLEGLQAILGKPGNRFVCDVKGVARTGSQLPELMQRIPPDLLLYDIGLPGADGLKMLPSLKKGAANTRILVISNFDDPRLVKAAFKAGADGYMLKSGSQDELFRAIEQVLSGHIFIGSGLSAVEKNTNTAAPVASFETRFARQYGLTRREIEILPYIGQAMSNKDISQKLYISDQTVSVHRKNIMRKLGVNNTATLIRIAYENNLV
jgi:DNA-binding NarL/FixJ family response regulator